MSHLLFLCGKLSGHGRLPRAGSQSLSFALYRVPTLLFQGERNDVTAALIKRLSNRDLGIPAADNPGSENILPCPVGRHPLMPSFHCIGYCT